MDERGEQNHTANPKNVCCKTLTEVVLTEMRLELSIF